MKITLTRSELKQIVAQRWNIDENSFQLVISGNDSTLEVETELLKKIKRAIRAVEAMDYNGVNKIEAIKTLRSIFIEEHLGLTESKYMVENWATVKPAMLSSGKLRTGP